MTQAPATLHEDAERFAQLLERRDRRACIAAAVGLIDDGLSVADFVLGVLAPALARLSDGMWHRGEWTAAYQQSAVEIADTLLAVTAARAQPGTADGRLVVCVAERDSQNLPARMLCELLRAEGFTVAFLGTPTMTAGVARMLGQMPADALVLSCSVPVNLPATVPLIEAAHDAGVPVLAAGRGFGEDDVRATCLGADCLTPRIDAVRSAVERLRQTPAPLAASTAERVQAQEILAIRAPLTEQLAEQVEYRSGHLLARGPRSRNALRDDLDAVLGWLAAAVLCDERILVEHVEGLAARGRHRRQDPRIVTTMLRTVEDRLAFDVPAAAAPLAAAQGVMRLAG
ncbi:hypothetical protein DSM112329_05174 [Paraconexibacter sp. AEG42_29]|uniref:B12-binding domain-containing protein n=1 Tax=Paraconexibacter sp. AEG42_29 TaxID=2997339 RepID=A0AAU7B2M7_9ACTN